MRLPARPRRRRSAALAAAVLGVGVAAGVGTGACAKAVPSRAHANDTVYVGYSSARVGPEDVVERGMRLAVDRLNAERAPDTRPFGLRRPLTPRPGELRPSQVAIAATLRDDSAVVAVIGPTGSGEALEVAPLYGDVEGGGARGLAALSPSASNPAVVRASPWLFRLCPSDDDAAVALARYAADSVGARRVAIVFRNDVFGRGFTGRVAAEFEARGVRVVERDPYLTGVTRYEAYGARIAQRGAEALVVAGSSRDVPAIMRAVHAAGARPALLGSDDVGLRAAALAADPDLRETRYVDFTAPPEAGPDTPARARFVAQFRAAYGTAPANRATLSYDGTLLVGRAVTAALADGVRGPLALRHAVRDRLARVGREDPAFAGAGGTIRFDANGGAVGRPVWIARVRPGS